MREDESTYILTSYLVANAMVLPISGWLANVIGRKRFYMVCVAIFAISSALCAFSTSLYMMVFFRILQGFGGGGLAPVEQSIFADTFPPAQRAIAFAIYGITIVTAPAIGPVVGGLITDNISWQWVFLINVPVGVASLALTWFFVSDSEQTKADRRELLAKGLQIDYVGGRLVATTSAHEIEGLRFDSLSRRGGIPVNTLLTRERYAVLYLRERLQVFYEQLDV